MSSPGRQKNPSQPDPKPSVQVFGRARTALIVVAVLSGIINVLMLTGSVFMMQVYDRVLSSRSLPTLVALAGITIALYAFSGLLEFVRNRIMIRVGRLFDACLRPKVLHAVIEHSVRRTPNVGALPVRDLDTTRQFLSGPGPFTLFDMPWVPVYAAANFLLHPWLGILTLAAAALMFAVALANELASRIGARETAAAAMTSHVLSDQASSSAEVIRAMGMSSSFGARWTASAEEVVRRQSSAADVSSIFSSIAKVLRYTLQSAALAVGAYLAIRGEVSAGVIIGGSIIMTRALAPIDQAIAHWRQYVGYRAARARLDEVLASVELDTKPMPLPQPRGALTVEAAVLMAPGTQRVLLQGIGFVLPAGASLGVVGPSGAGKSSLARALVGVWPLGKGAVRLDGARLEQWPPEQLGRSIGYVPQDVNLLSGTIQDNIARFDPRPDPEAVVAAAKRANVHDLIVRMPEGYNTRLDPGGAQLSAGQRQRIALARAMYGSPALLVLDEPNSNLDAEGDAALFAALQEVRASDTTTVIIAHRPSAIRTVDYLLYIKDGRQVAFGPKNEVLARIQGERVERAAAGLSVVRD
jgi:PrtD family type I secretion system ABC transporter